MLSLVPELPWTLQKRREVWGQRAESPLEAPPCRPRGRQSGGEAHREARLTCSVCTGWGMINRWWVGITDTGDQSQRGAQHNVSFLHSLNGSTNLNKEH